MSMSKNVYAGAFITIKVPPVADVFRCNMQPITEDEKLCAGFDTKYCPACGTVREHAYRTRPTHDIQRLVVEDWDEVFYIIYEADEGDNNPSICHLAPNNIDWVDITKELGGRVNRYSSREVSVWSIPSGIQEKELAAFRKHFGRYIKELEKLEISHSLEYGVIEYWS